MSSNLYYYVEKIEEHFENGGKIELEDDYVYDYWDCDQLDNYYLQIYSNNGKVEYKQIDCHYGARGYYSFRKRDDPIAIITPWKDPWCDLDPDEVIAMAYDKDGYPYAYKLFQAVPDPDIIVKWRQTVPDLVKPRY
jgi:hypothetical protein